MDAGTTDGALEHLRIFDGVGQHGVGRGFGVAQLGHGLDGIRQVHLRRLAVDVGQSVGNGLAQRVRHRQGQLLYAGHVLDAVLRGHRGVGDDVGAVLVTVLVLYPLQHAASAIVVEVGIDIGQRDTVGVQETLEQQIVLQRVNLRNAQTVGHHASGG